MIRQRSTELSFEQSLQQCYTQNLIYFRRSMPSLAKRIEAIQNPAFTLAIDDHQELNIWCQSKWFYDCKPSLYVEDQLTKAITRPEFLQLTVGNHDQKPEQMLFLHQFYLEKMRTIAITTKTDKALMFSPSLLFFGTGLGLHIEKTIQKTAGQVAFIFEPEFDIFYASLFTCRYHQFADQKTSLIFSIGETWEAMANKMSGFFSSCKMHYASKIQVVEHYRGAKILEAKAQIASTYGRFFDNAGFLEDETLGVAHFQLHLKNRPKLLTRKPIKKPAMPALVIGSGPSIDAQIATIKQHRDKFILFSCSSSIDILYRAGITPDFHTEIERVDPMLHYLSTFEDKAYLKNITLLMLNPCNPALSSFFKETFMALKFKDTGARLWNTHIGACPLLSCCGPTAGNGALAFAQAFGFDRIFLAGLDFGQKNDEDHHSKNTLYYTTKEHDTPTVQSCGNVKGNFGGEIRTTLWLDRARFSAETLIQSNPQIEFINCSDGALIRGAKPVPISQIEAFLHEKVLDEASAPCALRENTLTETSEIAQQVTDDTQSLSLNAYDIIHKVWSKTLSDIQNICSSDFLIHSNPSSIQQWFDLFDEIGLKYQRLSAKKPELSGLLFACLQGPTSSASTVLLHGHQQGDLGTAGQKVKELWNTYMMNVPLQCIKTQLLTDTERENLLRPLFQQENI